MKNKKEEMLSTKCVLTAWMRGLECRRETYREHIWILGKPRRPFESGGTQNLRKIAEKGF
jgi:hypothetical protein